MIQRSTTVRLLLVLLLPGAVLALSAVSEVEKLKGSGRTLEDAQARSAGCLSCHQGIEDIHNGRAHLACTDCHGGENIRRAADVEPGSERYQLLKEQAHVQPRFPDEWPNSGNPERTYTLLNRESTEFLRFVNPADLRVSDQSCGTSQCHSRETLHVKKSMMTTSAMLWGAALYNNGSYPLKDPHFGESYSNDGVPQRILAVPQPTPEETALKGILPYLDPLPRWDVMQPSNILRTWERGGRTAAEIGLPDPDALPGRPPRNLASARGLGTRLRTDPVYLGLQKTRLPDPMLSFLGTNDQPGDYRSSGCAACHMVYANDRDPFHSGPYAQYGNQGFSASADPTLPKDEPGHPIKHSFTRAIPTSQCIVCHVHPGTLVLNTYLGYTWWDLETDGEVMYPEKTRQLDAQEVREIQQRNPQGSALKGLWGDREFLKNSSELNDQLKHTQFADFHGHGWMYRAVFKQDRKGQLLDAEGKVISDVTSEELGRAVKETTEDPASREGVPVHLKDIHLERGMHCVDCHFANDSHGNGNLYGESRNAIEITCEDCHGTVRERARPNDLDWTTKGPAGGQPMLDYQNTPFDTQRFFEQDGKLHQRSAVEPEVVWEVVQVADTLDPSHDRYNEKARLAKTIQKGGGWGDVPEEDDELAHRNSEMTCYACHSSWVPSCFGCHLSTKANQKKPALHNEGEDSRNWTSYNWQTLRDDSFMLGRDGTVTGRRIAPVRSACAVMVSTQNAEGEWLYYQQQTISTEGYSGHAFSTHFPHTVRNTETRSCVDCHLSEDGDNNAYMAMALTQGTNFYNFLGRYVFVAEGNRGLEAVVVTEEEEPQAVIGSRLHELAHPEAHAEFVASGQELEDAHGHGGTTVLDLQARGEYLYAAAGKDGLQLFDIATLPQQGFCAASGQEPGFAARPTAVGRYDLRHRDRLAGHHRRRSDSPAPPRERGGGVSRRQAADPHALRLSLRHRPRRGPDPGQCCHAAGRQPGQQLPRAGRDLQPGRSPGRRQRHRHCRALRLHHGRPRSSDCRHRRSDRAAHRRRDRRSSSERGARGGNSVSLRVRARPGGSEGDRHHRSGAGTAGPRAGRDQRCSQSLPG